MGTRRPPGFVGSGEVLREFSQLPGLVIIHPAWLLLHRLRAVRLVDLGRSLLFRNILTEFGHLRKAMIAKVRSL